MSQTIGSAAQLAAGDRVVLPDGSSGRVRKIMPGERRVMVECLSTPNPRSGDWFSFDDIRPQGERRQEDQIAADLPVVAYLVCDTGSGIPQTVVLDQVEHSTLIDRLKAACGRTEDGVGQIWRVNLVGPVQVEMQTVPAVTHIIEVDPRLNQ